MTHLGFRKTTAAFMAIAAALLLPAGAQASVHGGDWYAWNDAPLAAVLKDAGTPRDFLMRRDHAALQEFYGQRDYEPLWVTQGQLNERAGELKSFLGQVETYGLNSKLYETPGLVLGQGADADAAALMSAELALSQTLLAYARHAQAGRLIPASLSKYLTNKPEMPDPLEVMAQVATAADLPAFLASFNPPHREFEVLRTELAKLRQIAEKGGWPTLSPGRTLKPGMHDPRTAELKQRFGIPMPPPLIADPRETDHYDGAVVEAVMEFQAQHGLEADGVIGPATQQVLSLSVYDRAAQIVANMERWRWLPRNLGRKHVFVDIPGFEVRVVVDNSTTYRGRIVVGKESNQTPVFSDEFEFIEVNPYWNVPDSIAANEVVPAVQADPDYLRRSNLELVTGYGRDERFIDPYSVNWSIVDAGNLGFRFRQPPGRGNALGSIKFMFPNKHDVYLHDTPARSLFSRQRRAFSHGCVRLHEPLKFAEALIDSDSQWNLDRIKREISKGQNQALPLPRKIPVHLTYFTAAVDENGKILLREDIYGHDRRIAAALGW